MEEDPRNTLVGGILSDKKDKEALNKIKQKIYRLLRWSQKYTQTDMVYLVEGGFWLGLKQVILTVTSFLLAITFANLLDPATYGNYRYILSVAGILGVFTLGGMETACAQAVARGFEESFYSGFKTKIKWGLLGSLGSLGLAGYYLIRGNYLLPIPLIILSLSLPLMYGSQIYISFLGGRKFFGTKVKYSTVAYLFSSLILMVTLFFTKNLLWLIAAYCASNTFLNYFFYLITKKKFQPNKKEDPNTISYGKHLSLMDALSVIAAKLDQILLFTLIGSSQLSVYSFALIVPDQIRALLKNISALAFPKLSTKSLKLIKGNMQRRSWQLFILASVIVVGYIIAAPYIYQILFPKYSDSVFYSQIYIFSVLTLPTTLMSTTFSAKIMKKELYFLRFLPFLQIVFLGILIPPFGILGALMAVLGTKVLATALTIFLFRRS